MMDEANNRASDIAIVGMSGLFPRAPDISTYWLNILNKVNAVGEPLDDWLGDEDFLDEDAIPENIRIYTKQGGFLNELSRFDPKPFGTMPLAVIGGEPDQFLALRGASEALADSGRSPSDIEPERSGIILGHTHMPNRGSSSAYHHSVVVPEMVNLVKSLMPEASEESLEKLRATLRSKLPRLNVDAAPGLVPNVMTGRIANRLNLMGPNYLLDAACASTLLAVEAACTELRLGRADLMLAGGVHTTTSPSVFMVFCQLEALSHSSRIRPFDKSADGTLLGEGLGVFTLRRLDDATKDGDRIYAVIKGVGSSSDGRAMGLMAPRLEGEVLAMKRAYEQTGLEPLTVDLVEAHGTGVPLGDRTEIQALRQVFGDRQRPYPQIALGSVKSMIGHSMPGAGAASMIKMAMALHHKILPPTLVEEINPDLGIEQTPFYLISDAAPWIHPGTHPRRAAVNSFGFGGVNSHMILEEAPGSTGAVDPGAAFGVRLADTPDLFVFAGAARDALVAQMHGLKQRLSTEPDTSLVQLAAETIQRAADDDGRVRLAMVASGASDLGVKLDRAIAKLGDPAVHRFQFRNGVYFTDQPLDGETAFLIPGENSQYPGMLKDLALSSPLVRAWFDKLGACFAGKRDIPHRFLMFPPPNNMTEKQRDILLERLRKVDAGSECVNFSDHALCELLRKLGVKPAFMVGHSTGEHSALVASGTVAVNREQIGSYVQEMNDIFQRLEESGTFPKGTLLTAGAISRDALTDVLKDRSDVWLTMENCPNQFVLFGPDDVMDRLTEDLKGAGALCMKLPLSWAYHTPMISPMAEELRTLIDRVDLGVPDTTLYSCASAQPFPDDDTEKRALMARQYVEPVKFIETIKNIYEAGARIFVEVGPNTTLTNFVRDILRHQPHLAVSVDSPKRGTFGQLHHLMAQLFVERVPIDLATLYAQATNDAEQQAEVSSNFFKMPPLRSELPYIRLSREDAAQFAGMFVGADKHAVADGGGAPQATGGASETAGSATGHTAVHPPRPVPARAGAVTKSGLERSATLAAHFSLMNTFLEQHREVTTAILDKTPSASPWMAYDLSSAFQMPFPIKVHLATSKEQEGGLAGLEKLDSLARRCLSVRELGVWQQMSASHPRRRQEWLLARFAAKTASRALLRSNNGARNLKLEQIEIQSGSNNQPFAALGNGAQRIPRPYISLSHVDGRAVAVSAKRPIGIDLENPERLQNPNGLTRIAFHESELVLLNSCLGKSHGDSAVLLWSIKEAVAKVSGLGLLGREQSVRLVDMAKDAHSALVKVESEQFRVEVRQVQDFYCCLAYQI